MKTEIEKSFLFERMPVKKAVLKQIVPSILSQMIVLIYNLADTYFVGMLNDPAQTAAVTVSYPVFVMLTAISNLFAVGGASLVARSLGQKDEDTARHISSVSFWCGLGCAVIFSFLFRMTASPVLRLCGATEATYDVTLRYAKWAVVAGGAGTILNVLLADLIRSEGNAVIAAFGVSLGGFANLILDPLFILPDFLGLGAEGAGLATALSNLLATLFFLIYIYARHQATVINVLPHHMKYAPNYVGKIVTIGIPSAIQYSLTVAAVASLSKFVSGYGTEAVAGLGIVKKLDQLPLYFSIGVANGLLPLLAYNFSSGDQKRRHNAFLFGSAISFAFSLLCLVCYETFAPVLAGLFIDDAVTIAYGAKFLRIMVIAMPMMSLCYPLIIQFQAMGNVKESLICSVLRKGVIDIPLLFLMDSLIPLYGCMTVQPIVDSISLIVAVYFYRRIHRASLASAA
ncbi:MAG: MATE family efflux transporter [Lachnospiraceae bacterium]|nr:MATE family efflux transporter [Lachnospiraceae bacterium]